MSKAELECLFAPITINGLTLPNRIVMAPMGRGFSPRGIPPDGFIDYFLRRIKGGVGLCIGEATSIDHPVAANDFVHSQIHGEAALAKWKAIVDAIHAAGGHFMPQLWHVGTVRAARSDDDLDDLPNAHLSPVGPSGWAEPLAHPSGSVRPIERAQFVNQPMSDSDIADVIDAFARAAIAARELGCDGINIHGAHGYLIDQFLWERTNLRTDRWGGDLVRRASFAVELVREVRRRVGPDFPIFLRLSQWKQQDYHCKLAADPHELEALLGPLADAGIDLFDCSTRRYWEPEFDGSPLNFAGWAKKLTGKASMTVGSVGLARSNWEDGAASPLSASETASLEPLLERLARGEFDLVGVGRMLISNPDWPNAIREGRDEEIRPYSNAHLATLD